MLLAVKNISSYQCVTADGVEIYKKKYFFKRHVLYKIKWPQYEVLHTSLSCLCDTIEVAAQTTSSCILNCRLTAWPRLRLNNGCGERGN